MRRWIAMIIIGLGLVACEQPQGLSIRDAEFRPPLGSSNVGAAYFTIRSSTPDRIVAISSSEADAVEIHSSVTESGMMIMKRMETLPLPAGKTVAFAPGGLHLMVFSPRLKGAETVLPITIELESGVKRTTPFRIHGEAARQGS